MASRNRTRHNLIIQKKRILCPTKTISPMPHSLLPDPSNLHSPSARYYNSALSIWLSVDPMADKYPSTSPYTYCANNPVRLVDPNGEDIWIFDNGAFYKYINGKLYTQDGEEFKSAKGTFAHKVQNALNKLSTTTIGGEMIERLSTCEDEYYIQKSGKSNFIADECSYHKENGEIVSGGIINWNPRGALLPTNGFFSRTRSPITDLGHELSHAFDHKNKIEYGGPIRGLSQQDWAAVYRENCMRRELGKPLRTHYGSVIDQYQCFLNGAGPKTVSQGNLVLPKEVEINMNWYKR